tara:strand:+ start:4531 stop:4953 length:423 start_codon:yes stop_codon:yes gene_type:complete
MFGNKPLKAKIKSLENDNKQLVQRNAHLESEINVLRSRLNELGELNSIHEKSSAPIKSQSEVRSNSSSVNREEPDSFLVMAATLISFGEDKESQHREAASEPAFSSSDPDTTRSSGFSSGFSGDSGSSESSGGHSDSSSD